MRIANPLYDHAFKYLMANEKLARKVLSTIIDRDVISVDLSQQEIVIEDEIRNFTLYRLDFKATIKNSDGKEETVLIELQKSKLPTNLQRFRTYLGSNYMERRMKKKVDSQEEYIETLPIIAIYILGYNVEDIPYLATKIDRKIIDASTKEEVEINSDFIELLTHTTFILQVRRLPKDRRTRIERFMTLFNQRWVEEDESYIIDLEEVPVGFEDIADYLGNSLKNDELKKNLMAEREIEDLFAITEAKFLQKEEEIKRLTLLEQEERRQKEEERRQKEEILGKMIKMMVDMGKSKEDIIDELKLDKETILRLM